MWKNSIDLVKAVNALSREFPADEKFGLTSQLRRAVVSIPSNIAEGAARGGRREFAHFITVARGSLAEVETQIVIARELGFVGGSAELDQKVLKLYKQLNALHRSLNHG